METTNTPQQENKKKAKQLGNYLFVGCLFLGMAAGWYTGNLLIGMFAGMGIGFILAGVAFVSLTNKK